MMQCQEARSKLDSYLDQELDSNNERMLFWHLSGCPQCHHELEKAREFDKLLVESCTLLDPPEELTTRVMAAIEGETFSPQQKKPLAGSVSTNTRWKKWRYSLSALVGAAAVVLFVMTGINFLPRESAPVRVGMAETGGDTVNSEGLPAKSEDVQLSKEQTAAGNEKTTALQTPAAAGDDGASSALGQQPAESSGNNGGQNQNVQSAGTVQKPESNTAGQVVSGEKVFAQVTGQQPGENSTPPVEADNSQPQVAQTEIIKEGDVSTILTPPKPAVTDPEGTLSIAGKNVQTATVWVQRISSEETTAVAPAWDADGVRYIAWEDGKFVVKTAGNDGSGKDTLLTLPDDAARGFAWNHAGNHLAYQVTREGKEFIKLIDDAGAVFELEGSLPAWSSKDELAFVKNTEAGQALAAYSTAGGEKILAVSTGSISGLSWSPDGRMLAYINGSSGGNRVMLLTKGQQPLALTEMLPAAGMSISWSPDSKRLVVSRSGSGQNGGLWLLAADGKSFKQLTESADGTAVQWSPDGQKIAYADKGKVKVAFLDPAGSTVKITEGETRSRVNIVWDANSKRLLLDWGKQGEKTSVWLAALPQDNQS